MSLETDSLREMIAVLEKTMIAWSPIGAGAAGEIVREMTTCVDAIDTREKDWQRDLAEDEEVITHFGLYEIDEIGWKDKAGGA